jgi:hypothetical protein
MRDLLRVDKMKKENVIEFVGKGIVDDEEIEIRFKTIKEQIDFKDKGLYGLRDIEIIIKPLVEDNGVVYRIITNKTEKEPTYIVMYKNPKQPKDLRERFEVFEGVCENFAPSGKCAFSNGLEKLIVHYDDILQMKPIKD